MIARLIANGDRNAAAGFRRARAAALVLLALPGSAYLYQGEELGLPEVTDIPDDARQDPQFFRTHGTSPGRDGCRVPIPWAPAGTGFGFSRTRDGASPAAPWLPQPPDWGSYSVESQLADERSFLHLYRAALRLRRGHPALGRGTLRWLSPEDSAVLCFARDPGFILAVNFGPDPAPLPVHREILLASGSIPDSTVLPSDTAAWLSA
jgi:alpha-glucosidase